MLKPAILYKTEILQGMKEAYYTDDMLYETGGLDQWCPNIPDEPSAGMYQWAIVNNNGKLLGFLTYFVDFYADNVYKFGLFSLDRGNPLVGKEVFKHLESLVSQHHRVEWRAVSGNPACRGYDKFCQMHNGNRYVLKDIIRDSKGEYHDSIIYEIVKGD